MAEADSPLARTYRQLLADAGRALALAGNAVTVGGKPFRSAADSQSVDNALGSLSATVVAAAEAAGRSYPSRAALTQTLDAQLTLIRSSLGLVKGTLDSVEAREKARANQALGNAADMIAAAGRQRAADATFATSLDGTIESLAAQFRAIEAQWQAPETGPGPGPGPGPGTDPTTGAGGKPGEGPTTGPGEETGPGKETGITTGGGTGPTPDPDGTLPLDPDERTLERLEGWLASLGPAPQD